MDIQIQKFHDLASDLSGNQVHQHMYMAGIVLGEPGTKTISGSISETFMNLSTVNYLLDLIYHQNADSIQVFNFLAEIDYGTELLTEPIKSAIIAASSGRLGDQSEFFFFSICRTA